MKDLPGDSLERLVRRHFINTEHFEAFCTYPNPLFNDEVPNFCNMEHRSMIRYLLELFDKEGPKRLFDKRKKKSKESE